MPRALFSMLITAALLGAAAPGRAASDGVEVDRIEITGVTLFEASAIEGALEIGAGDRLVRSKVVASAENLQALYRMVGYTKVQIQSELLRDRGEKGQPENVLRIKVLEGDPTRVAVVRMALAPASTRAPEWALLREQLIGKLDLKAGDVMSQDRLAATRRQVQDALAAEEFVGARVTDVRVVPVGRPSGAVLPASDWVDLVYELDLGDRVTFGFRGNTVYTRSHLLTLVEEQRQIGLGADYVAAIRGRIEQEYRAAGYAQVEVRPLTFERSSRQERHVTYEISEGSRVRIESIEFEGNSAYTAEELLDRFYALSARAVENKIYVEKEVESAAERLIEWLKSQGYLASKLVTINRIVAPRGLSVRLIIYVYEGDRTTVDTINISGNQVLSGAEIRSLLGVREEAPLNLYRFSEGIEALKVSYRSRGYLDMKIENENQADVVAYFQENRLARIHIAISEGIQYRLARVELEGLTSTRSHVVLREIQLKPGDVLEESKIIESEARLRKLGIFSMVNTRLIGDSKSAERKILKVTVQEGTPGIIAGGLGYRNDLGARAFGEVGYSNLWQRNHTLSFGANVNRRFDTTFCDNNYDIEKRAPNPDSCFPEYQLQVGYNWPWFMLGDTTFRPRLTLERAQYRMLDAATLSLSLTWERRLLQAVNLTGLFTYSLERTFQNNARTAADNRNLTIGAITPALILDLRDDSLAPTRGFYASTTYEFASTALLSQTDPQPVGYGRFQLRTDYTVPLPAAIRWQLSFRMGYEQNFQPPGSEVTGSERQNYQIPVIKQFTMGGIGSIRGFQEQQLTAEDIAILGTLSYVNYRTQLDFPFAGAVTFGPFLDAGNLLVDDFSLGRLRYGAGLGLRYFSPVGPINFDWGFKLNKPKDEKFSNAFHFSIGLI